VRGMGVLVDAHVPDVQGATGYYDTDYSAKVAASLIALDSHDVVLLHIAAANEACHETDVRLKVRVIEDIDRFVVAPLTSALRKWTGVRLLLTTDHMTSTLAREGATDRVPFAVWGTDVHPVRANRFTEAEAEEGELHVEDGHSMLEYVMGGRRTQPTPAADLTGADG
jgi:2,3-bisphosphoglycerate-independent phosphoglycerate mutase